MSLQLFITVIPGTFRKSIQGTTASQATVASPRLHCRYFEQLIPVPAATELTKQLLIVIIESEERKVGANLFLAQLADLLLHHGDLPVHTVHILDKLLLGESSWYQIQVGVHMHRTNWGDWLELSHGTSTLLQVVQ